MMFDSFDLYESCEEYYANDDEFYFDDFDLSTLSPADKAELDALFDKNL